METNLLLSKFWTRIWALLLDSILLGIFGFILGFFFQNYFISLGENAKLIGWSISLIYFSVLNSNINQGQTFGKKLMGIQVVDSNGNFIYLKTSIIRALILTAPFFLNGYKISGTSSFSVVAFVQSIIIFALGIGSIIFYILNKQTRQSIHDLIAKTYVVQDYRSSTITVMPKVGKLPFYILGGIFAIIICSSIYSYTSNSTIKKLIPLYEKLSQQKNISNASIVMNYPPMTDNTGTQRNIYTVVIKTKKNLKDINQPAYSIKNKELQETVKTFIESHVYDSDNDILSVSVNSGYDIGISKSNYELNISQPIYKWKEVYKL
ncbi:RDD family protein [Chryseobacterium sp. PMSZPI]|uniref:RDD family protein n=1 Tax=Chryseobacterium sp. PMSZPI TaxID=1033900 RepID=UPI000C337364|nr:RDD family protein [Chryseobacterium sp. PMSZPI]PKF74166.1 hypothetical protein CW752_10740 [Chryseobacterium sp. PMSZPI]